MRHTKQNNYLTDESQTRDTSAVSGNVCLIRHYQVGGIGVGSAANDGHAFVQGGLVGAAGEGRIGSGGAVFDDDPVVVPQLAAGGDDVVVGDQKRAYVRAAGDGQSDVAGPSGAEGVGRDAGHLDVHRLAR